MLLSPKTDTRQPLSKWSVLPAHLVKVTFLLFPWHLMNQREDLTWNIPTKVTLSYFKCFRGRRLKREYTIIDKMQMLTSNVWRWYPTYPFISRINELYQIIYNGFKVMNDIIFTAASKSGYHLTHRLNNHNNCICKWYYLIHKLIVSSSDLFLQGVVGY